MYDSPFSGERSVKVTDSVFSVDESRWKTRFFKLIDNFENTTPQIQVNYKNKFLNIEKYVQRLSSN